MRMDFELVPFEPVELTDDDLRGFGLSEAEIAEWRSTPIEWTEEDKIFARKLQLIFQEFDIWYNTKHQGQRSI